MLLLATLLRLALNVASTRVVLLHGHEGSHAAGKVIEAFGEFVIGGNYAVGVVVFVILTIINFVVVTKGAGRISEVSARFTLDAMPGKQMAIDADLNAGLITQDEARARRAEVRAEADFYGSMDGASKFVRGDAIAGILILVINIVGGLLIGTMMHDLPFGEAAKTYTLLTIGDGLVAQIPALLLSVAVAIIVTRVSREQDMGGELGKQLFGQPKALGVAAGVLGVMGLIPGMPNIAFLSMAALCGWGAWRLVKKREAAAPAVEELAPEPPPPPPSPKTQELSWDDVRPVDVVGLEVGYRLVPLVDRTKGGDLLARIRGIRRKLTQELGFLVQAVHIRDNLELGPNSLSHPARRRGHRRERRASRPRARDQSRPRVRPAQRHRDARSGVRHGSGVDRAVAARARAVARLHGGRCRHRDRDAPVAPHPDARARAVRPRRSPAAAEDSRQDRAEAGRGSDAESAAAGHGRARHAGLLAERVPIRNMRAIVEALAEAGPRIAGPAACSSARSGLPWVARSSRTSSVSPKSCPSSRLSPISSAYLSNGLANSPPDPGLEPGLAERLQRGLQEAAQRQERGGEPAVLLTPPALRAALARFFRVSVPGLHVLAWNEMPDNRKVRMVTAVGAR